MNRAIRWTLLVFLLQVVAAGATGWTTPQTVALATNWNLISLWVQPSNAAPEAVFASLIGQGRLSSVFTYEYDTGGTQGVWKRFYPGLPANRAWLNTLTQVRAGQGYWVNVPNGSPTSLTVTGSVTTLQSIGLRPGGNLIGLSNDRRVFWADVLGVLAGGVQSLYAFNATSKAFMGFSQPAFGLADVNGNGLVETNEFGWMYQNEAGQLRYIEPGQGLWVKVTNAMPLGPVLEVEVESDVDPFPPGATTNTWFEAGIDTDMNGDGWLDYGFKMPGQHDPRGRDYANTQDTIWFRVPTGAVQSNLVILRQDITVLNDGLDGSGMLHFEVEKDVPWLFVSPVSGAVLPGPGGQVVTLQAELAGLPIGEQPGTLRVWGNGTNRAYTVRLTVPELDGLYSGEITLTNLLTLTNLEGRLTYPLTWAVQMQLDLRGVTVLEEAGSPNFPIDIALANSGSVSNFELSGSVALNAGDAGNPFNQAIQRDIWFRGARIAPTPGQTVGMNLGLMGQYEEIVSGLPSGPVLLRGFFTLNAKTNKKPLEEP